MTAIEVSNREESFTFNSWPTTVVVMGLISLAAILVSLNVVEVGLTTMEMILW